MTYISIIRNGEWKEFPWVVKVRENGITWSDDFMERPSFDKIMRIYNNREEV